MLINQDFIIISLHLQHFTADWQVKKIHAIR